MNFVIRFLLSRGEMFSLRKIFEFQTIFEFEPSLLHSETHGHEKCARNEPKC